MKPTLTLITILLLTPPAALGADDDLWSHVRSMKELGELRGMMDSPAFSISPTSFENESASPPDAIA